MSDKTESKLRQFLIGRREENLFRQLISNNNLIDFCSNDYIGLASSDILSAEIENVLTQKKIQNGSGGSRLLAGNKIYHEELEKILAEFHNAESALIFNSGYDANIGLISCIASKEDTIITDEFVHASIIDGCRLSYASKLKFTHNDVSDLKEKLKFAKGNIFIVIESVYSMDGDFAPLIEIISLAEEFNANVIVDEAHSTGVFGNEGRGLVNELNMEEKIFARIHTFGKALGAHGACVVGSEVLKNYLINSARSFIYTTALPQHSIISIQCGYEKMRKANAVRKTLFDLIDYFIDEAKKLNIDLLCNRSPIQTVVISGNENCRNKAQLLQQNGFDIRAILSPTVPVGKERLRICLHSFNTKEQVYRLLNIFSKFS